MESVLTDPETSAELAARLEHVQQVVEFAADLGLSVDGQYTSYVEWPGNRIVTTLVATLPRSISASEFWFPLIGNAPYKGFFDPERAARNADQTCIGRNGVSRDLDGPLQFLCSDASAYVTGQILSVDGGYTAK